MSLVQPGLLRKLYEDASQGIGSKPTGFWVSVLRRAFNEPDTYAVIIESSSDERLRQVDLVVERYDAENDDIVLVLLWIECEGTIREVESQALDAAQRYIGRDGLSWIWVMTTVGVKFRMWIVEAANSSELRPVHGGNTSADLNQYIDASSQAAAVFPDTVDHIKRNFPLRKAPTVPTQSLDLLSGTDAGPSSA